MSNTLEISAENAAPPSLTQTTTRGFAWFMAQTLGAKLLGMASQLALAWLLTPEDFGLIGLAYTLTAFAALLQMAGLRDVLVQKHREFDTWANSAFWLSIALGVAAGLVMAGMAPLAVMIYRDPRLLGIILVMAASAPLSSISTVPWARIQSQLRFRASVSVVAIEALGSPLLSVCFAFLGFRAYSFVLPRLVTAALQAIVLFRMAHMRVSWRIQIDRWRLLLADTAMLLGAQLVLTLAAQGDRLILGLFHSTAVVGVYFFAFGLSTQTVQLLSGNLFNVLLPSLAQLQTDIARQTAAYLRVTRLLAVVSTPLSLLQAALAAPVVRLLFASKWRGAIPALEVLSIGMAFAVIAGPAWSMIKAQGRFKTFFYYACAYALAVVVFSIGGAMVGEAFAVAVTTTICFALFCPLVVYLGGRPGGTGWLDVIALHAKPFAVSAVAVGLGLACCAILPVRFARDWTRIPIVTAVTSVVYPLLARRFCADEWNELRNRIRGLFSRR